MGSEKKRRKKATVIVWSILLLVVATVVIVAFFALKDDFAGQYRPTPSGELVKKMVSASMTGGEVWVSDEEVSGLLAYQMQGSAEWSKTDNISLEQICLDVNEDGTISLYTPITVKGIRFGVTSVSELEYVPDQQEVKLSLLKMRVGRLEIPPKWALDYAKEKLAKGLKVTENSVILDLSAAKLALKFYNINLELIELRTENGGFLISLKNPIDPAKESVKDYLKEKFGEKANEIDGYVDGLADYLKNYLEK